MKKEEEEPEAGSIVATIETREVATIPQPRNSFNGYNLDAWFDLDHTTGSKDQKQANCLEKLSASPRQIY
jgi:hypothetical protein